MITKSKWDDLMICIVASLTPSARATTVAGHQHAVQMHHNVCTLPTRAVGHAAPQIVELDSAQRSPGHGMLQCRPQCNVHPWAVLERFRLAASCIAPCQRRRPRRRAVTPPLATRGGGHESGVIASRRRFDVTGELREAAGWLAA